MSSPITTWENASAVYTYADSPIVVGTIVLIAVGLTVFSIVASLLHEKKSFNSPMEK